MENEDQVAPSEATDEEVIAVEEPKETEGANPPAEDKPEGESEDKTQSQLRRERRKAHENRIREEKEQAEARAKAAEERLARIEKRLSGLPDPKESDFADPLEYAAVKGGIYSQQATARADIEELQSERKAAQDAITAAETRRMEMLQKSFQEQVSERRAAYPDLDSALTVAASKKFVSDPLAALILEADQPVDVAYYLGKNPDKALELSRMPPQRAAYELGRIEARLAQPQPKLKSSAPDPISPVKTGANITRDPLKMNAKEFAEWRAAGGTF